MQTSHTMNALLSPHRMPIHQPDITYRTRFAAYSARDTAFIYMETPCTNDKTDKQRIHDIRFQPGSTALMHIPDPLPCNDIFGNRSDSMPCVLYLLEAKRPIVQIEHRYIGIGHCNRPGCIQRKMFRQAVHSLSHIVPACTHGGNRSCDKKSIKTRGAYHECTGKTIPSLSAVDSPAGIEPCLRQSTMLTAVSCIASASNSAIQREFPVAVK